MVLAKDVANWIEHKNPSKMLNGVDDDEKLIAVCDVTNSYTTSKSRNTQEMWLLTEDGLYEVLMQSRKPIAKAFKKEVKQNIKRFKEGVDFIDLKGAYDTSTLINLGYAKQILMNLNLELIF